MGFPGPPVASLTIGNAEQRSAVYSSSVSTNKLDTAQMAIIKYTLTSTSDASGAEARPDACEKDFGTWPFSTIDTNTVAVAVSAGSPWSFTSTNRVCRGKSTSSRARVVLISPVYRPTRKGLRTPPVPNCTSYDSHAL
uniref:Uncharacterized protein n=1 Tax=Mus spicilegus TaxID=10103 RepID=A0A8C6MVE7_MUSSI